MENVDFDESSYETPNHPYDKHLDSTRVSEKVEEESKIPFTLIICSSNKSFAGIVTDGSSYSDDFRESDLKCRVKRTRFRKVSHVEATEQKRLRSRLSMNRKTY